MEGEREGDREGKRERGREGVWEGGREGGGEGGGEGGREGGREGEVVTGKERRRMRRIFHVDEMVWKENYLIKTRTQK